MIFNEKFKSLFKKYDSVSERMRNIEEIFSLIDSYLGDSLVERKKNGEVFTPFKLINEILDKLPIEVWSNPDLKWLDPANGVGNFPAIIIQRLMEGLKNIIKDDKERYEHILTKQIYICDISSKNMFLYLNIFDPNHEYVNDMNYFKGSFLDEGFDKWMMEKLGADNKFDIVVGNPPYKQGTHHKFILKGFELLKDNGEILILHPSTLFISRKDVKKNEIEKKLLDIIKLNKVDLTLVNGFDYFTEAKIIVPLSITNIKKTKQENITVNYNYLDGGGNMTFEVNSIEEIYIHGSNLVHIIKNKIFNKMESSIEQNLFRNGKKSPFYLKIVTMAGHAPKNGKMNPDFYNMIYKQDENNIDSLISNRGVPMSEKVHINQIGLNSYDECVNMANTLMTKFMRFCLSFYKISGYLTRGELKAVPFLDPKIRWTDDKLFQCFELDLDEINYIKEFIGNWYQRDFD